MIGIRSANSGRKRICNYLPVKIEGRDTKILLDSGSDVTLIPLAMVRNHTIIPTDERVLAANGTPIAITGETCIKLQVGRHCMKVKALVSDHVSEGILGISWMEDQHVMWMLGNGMIMLNGEMFELEEGPKPTHICSRVWLKEDVCVPKETEMIVPGKNSAVKTAARPSPCQTSGSASASV